MLALVLCCLSLAAGDDVQKRQDYLTELRRTLPPCPEWEAWLTESGELPPDFDTLPSSADLPNPLLRRVHGRDIPVTCVEEWEDRREELRSDLQHWILGTFPLRPENLQASVLAEAEEEGARRREVVLSFGPGHKAHVRLELLIPAGAGPFPVFLTQANHRGWALVALRRGYLACVYAGADVMDDTDTFLDAYPGYDWSRLMRRAWAGSRCIDYLETVPEAREDQIAITGHSRNGKQSLMASAMDERVAAVISSSSGSGGSMTARHYAEPLYGESIEVITRHHLDWFHPRWRFFSGREHKLPVDLHELVALTAPRPCLLSIALNDGVETAWGLQQTYLAVQPVYALYGAKDSLQILWRPGGHETVPSDIERYLDWLDAQFGRGQTRFPERLLYPHNWEGWRKRARPLDLSQYAARPLGTGPAPIEQTRSAVRDMLGPIPTTSLTAAGTYGRDPDHIDRMLKRGDVGKGLEKDEFVFGDYISADVYMPAGTKGSGKKLPAILWLHPWCSSHGYSAAYSRDEQPFRTLAREGYAVFCYDQLGFGRRLEQVEGFYDRFPDSSMLARMVSDAQAAFDAIRTLPYVDPEQVWVVGYSLGAFVGLHLMALDERPAGAAFVCGPPPFRLDKDSAETGGFRRWSQLYMLAPRLGFFVGREDRVPYDIDDLLAAAAPRPVLVVSPRLDHHAPPALVARAVESARRAYEAPDRLTLAVPDTYHQFEGPMQRLVLDWLAPYTLAQPVPEARQPNTPNDANPSSVPGYGGTKWSQSLAPREGEGSFNAGFGN